MVSDSDWYQAVTGTRTDSIIISSEHYNIKGTLDCVGINTDRIV